MKKQTKYTNHPDFPHIEDVVIINETLDMSDYFDPKDAIVNPQMPELNPTQAKQTEKIDLPLKLMIRIKKEAKKKKKAPISLIQEYIESGLSAQE